MMNMKMILRMGMVIMVNFEEMTLDPCGVPSLQCDKPDYHCYDD